MSDFIHDLEMQIDALKEENRVLREALEAAYEYLDLKNQVDPTAGYEYELAEQVRAALSTTEDKEKTG